MTKRFSITISDWVYDQYLQGVHNRSKYIEEMLVKGVNAELGEYKGVHNKAIDAIKQLRIRDNELANLRRELAIVKSRVFTQEQRRKEKEKEKARKEEHLKKAMTAKGLKDAGLLRDGDDI